MISSENRIILVQIMIDSVNLYNTYKYDSDYGKLKVFVSKFLEFPTIEVSSTAFENTNEELDTADVKVREGKSYMFSMRAQDIPNALRTIYIDFQIMLESDSEEKKKSGIHNIVVGQTRIQLQKELEEIVSGVDTVTSETFRVKEIEGGYVIRQNDVHVGTIYVGIRFTMFGSSLTTSIKGGPRFFTKPFPAKETPKTLNDPQTENITHVKDSFGKEDPSIKYHSLPDENLDIDRDYTYIYSELNGQVIDMKVTYDQDYSTPGEMAKSHCVQSTF